MGADSVPKIQCSSSVSAPVLTCHVRHMPLNSYLQQTPGVDGALSRFQPSAGIAVILDTAQGDIVGEAGLAGPAGLGPEVAGLEHGGE